jgi:hypothetical protein
MNRSMVYLILFLFGIGVSAVYASYESLQGLKDASRAQSTEHATARYDEVGVLNEVQIRVVPNDGQATDEGGQILAALPTETLNIPESAIIENASNEEQKKAYQEMMARELEHTRLKQVLRREKRQKWIPIGIHRGKVEQIASKRGAQRYSQYSETGSVKGGSTRVFLVHEYRFSTDHFDHIKKVYFDRYKRVAKVLDTAQPRIF